ncbi:MAG: hypothetical protein AAGF92_21130 [Myxococcota bacterium]
MTTSRAVPALALIAALACGDGAGGAGGTANAPDGAGGTAGTANAPLPTGGRAGSGGSGGTGGADLSVLPCALREAVVSEPGNESCEEGCTRTTGRIDNTQYFVACVQNESLETEVGVFDATVCMTSPVDGLDYRVSDPLDAQAVAQVCWIPCSASDPLDPAFEEWIENDVTGGTGLHFGLDVWLARCGDIWSL